MTRNAIEQMKIWLFPTLISLLAAVIWQDVNEIKADVKALITQSAADKVKIDNLEKQVEVLNGKVFVNPTSTSNQSSLPTGGKPPLELLYRHDLYYEQPKKIHVRFIQTHGAAL